MLKIVFAYLHCNVDSAGASVEVTASFSTLLTVSRTCFVAMESMVDEDGALSENQTEMVRSQTRTG